MEENMLVLADGTTYQKGELVLQKKAKAFYAVKDHPEFLIMRFLDVVTSDNGRQREEIPGKGQNNAQISNIIFKLLQGTYTNSHRTTPIKTHFVGASQNDPAECLVLRMAQAIPIEVIVRNHAYGNFVERYTDRYGIKEGDEIQEGPECVRPICEFTLKDDAQDDPLIAWDHIWALKIASEIEIGHMRDVALAVNRILVKFFAEIGIGLMDFKLVFGRQSGIYGDFSNLRIIGEISPDTGRLRDLHTGKILDKDIFRRSLPGLAEAYQTVSQKLLDFYADEENDGKVIPYICDGYGNFH